MLTQETKRHIDAARQVLVGVVPNPTSQIDQITNALIYKFMDDMDQLAIRAGGDPSFFTGDLERYSWTSLMDSRLGNQERMNLYSEALVKFSEAKQLPQLFREIFKSAFLPYRSPEVLGLFLKEIAYFDYSHSEELGNAYEYLLSIMSSQGDAGQFRTPRHIIDFIVKVVDPAKADKVLDPACGTAGFLVSAYKHILEQHDGVDEKGKKNNDLPSEALAKGGKPLTPDERRALMKNFEGYDVDPGMVRISQVNMYLHHFKNPKIYNYNTLAQEERWGDKFNVILANPPFMSPKGGVSTHKKFRVPSNRSEVLFVDYIMNHLRPRGRAGIIVPEGIIFQSATAYKKLRENLVKDGLYAVVSLPSGVFQPYAGVKTSILLFDNELASRNTEMLFVKVENDGFDLGASKRPIKKNDLPQALEIISAWKAGRKVESKLALYVGKDKIVESGDYNLTGDRYRVATDYSDAKWPMLKLGEVCTFEYGKPLKEDHRKGGGYPVFGSNGVVGLHNEYLVEGPFIIVGRKGTAGAVVYSEKSGFPIDTTFYVKLSDKDKIGTKFLYYTLRNLGLDQINTQAGVPGLNRNDAYKCKIPLPPLEVQEQIVAELDGYQSIISGARQIVENWKPKIDVDPEWGRVKIGDVAKLEYGIGESAKDQGELRYIRITDIDDKGELKKKDKKFIAENVESKKYILKKGDVLVARTGATFGKTLCFDSKEKSAFAGFLIRINFDDNVLSRFFWCYAQSEDYWIQARSLMTGGGQPQFNANAVSQIIFPLPSIDIQEKIIEKIEIERALVESSRKLIEIYEQKTKDVLSKLWNE